MTSMQDIYDSRVATGDLTRDPAQEAVLPELERIRAGLAAPIVKKKGWFKKAKPELVKGLYLWGGVGRGKSMLMDMFVDALDVPARRVHPAGVCTPASRRTNSGSSRRAGSF